MAGQERSAKIVSTFYFMELSKANNILKKASSTRIYLSARKR